MNPRTWAKVVATCLLVFPLSDLVSAADYPAKDIRTIVPWGAGGGTDAIARKIMSIAEQSLPVAIYVENIEGGMSATGVMELSRARPDGHTLGTLTYDSVITVPWQGLLPGYGLDKLRLISRITAEPDAIMVLKDAPYQSLDDLLKAAKERPGEIRVGIQGLGSRVHLAMLQLQSMTGTEFRLIPYPAGAAPQKEALLSGEVDAVITSLGDFAPEIQSGKARGLVELSEARNPAFPDVPTAKELGLDLQIGSFIIIAAPAGTPDDVVEKLESTFREAYDSSEFQDWLAKTGVSPAWLGSDEVTDWANETQNMFFAMMEDLVDQGILKK